MCELRNLTASGYPSANNRTPFEITFGYSPNISEYVTFQWYQIVWYWNPEDIQKQRLGRWLGVSKNIGSGHSYLILSEKGEVISRSTVSSLTTAELNNNRIKDAISLFDSNINSLIGNYSSSVVRGQSINPNISDIDFIQDDEEYTGLESDNIDYQEMLSKESADIFQIPDADGDEYNETLSSELNDLYIGTRVILPQDGEMKSAVVKSRKRTSDGKMLIGKRHSNPILDSRVYITEFDDGGVAEYTTNILAESIYSNIDDDGMQYAILEGILGHRKTDDAIKKQDGFVE